MDTLRTVMKEAAECCGSYIDNHGQPAMFALVTFPPAASFEEFKKQEQQLSAHLDYTGACRHIRDVAVQTHRTLCGNEQHVATEKQMSYFPGVPYDMLKELLGDLINL